MIASTSQKKHHPNSPVSISITNNKPAPLFLPQNLITHDPKAGLNPLVDACSKIFSTMCKLKMIKSLHHPAQVQQDLLEEIHSFQTVIKNHGYNAEYMSVCRYILCAFIDDIIANSAWGNEGRWERYLLLTALNQDCDHHDKFFALIDRCIKEPTLYIDLMELIYICLSLGYKGRFRSTEHHQIQLELITNNLYQHIRAYRGNISKRLAPEPLLPTRRSPSASTTKAIAKKQKTSLLSIFLLTASAVMVIFISLGYFMDIITNEPFKHVKEIQVSENRHSGEF